MSFLITKALSTIDTNNENTFFIVFSLPIQEICANSQLLVNHLVVFIVKYFPIPDGGLARTDA
jgi:hypothetical protein